MKYVYLIINKIRFISCRPPLLAHYRDSGRWTDSLENCVTSLTVEKNVGPLNISDVGNFNVLFLQSKIFIQ